MLVGVVNLLRCFFLKKKTFEMLSTLRSVLFGKFLKFLKFFFCRFNLGLKVLLLRKFINGKLHLASYCLLACSNGASIFSLGSGNSLVFLIKKDENWFLHQILK